MGVLFMCNVKFLEDVKKKRNYFLTPFPYFQECFVDHFVEQKNQFMLYHSDDKC